MLAFFHEFFALLRCHGVRKMLHLFGQCNHANILSAVCDLVGHALSVDCHYHLKGTVPVPVLNNCAVWCELWNHKIRKWLNLRYVIFFQKQSIAMGFVCLLWVLHAIINSFNAAGYGGDAACYVGSTLYFSSYTCKTISLCSSLRCTSPSMVYLTCSVPSTHHMCAKPYPV